MEKNSPSNPKSFDITCWESNQQRRWAPENSHQSYEQVNKEKKERTQDLTRFDNLPTSSGQGERVIIELINYRLQVINIGDNTPLYIAKETIKKRKPKTSNLNQKRIQNQI